MTENDHFSMKQRTIRNLRYIQVQFRGFVDYWQSNWVPSQYGSRVGDGPLVFEGAVEAELRQ